MPCVLTCVDSPTALVPQPAAPQTSGSPRGERVFRRLAAVLLTGIAAMCGVIAAGMVPLNTEWIPGWIGLTLIYLVAAHAQWTGRRWARGYGLGITLWGLVANVEALLVLGLQPLLLTAVGLCLALVLLQLLGRGRDEPGGRLLLSMMFASAAVPCAMIYGLAPQHTWLVSAGVLGGALLVVSGAWGVCRGRTWGLLVGLAGAISITVTIAKAQHVGWLLHPHPLLPRDNPLALLGLGIAGAGLSFAATLLFVAPMVRFLVRATPE